MTKKISKKEKDAAFEMIHKYQKNISDAQKYGKQVAKRIIKKYESDGKKVGEKGKGLMTDLSSEVLSEIMFQCYKKGEEDGCQELLKQWTEERFWGRIVEEHIPEFNELWEELRIKKYDKNNTFDYGDLDASVWIEKSKNKKIIIHKSHCSCANDNTHIFISEKGFFGKIFHVRTVWPRERNKGGYAVKKSKKYPTGWFSWGDDRDISTPSLNTYRTRDFNFDNMSNGSEGYVLSINGITKRSSIKWAGLNQQKIEHALWLIKIMKKALIKEENNDK